MFNTARFRALIRAGENGLKEPRFSFNTWGTCLFGEYCKTDCKARKVITRDGAFDNLATYFGIEQPFAVQLMGGHLPLLRERGAELYYAHQKAELRRRLGLMRWYLAKHLKDNPELPLDQPLDQPIEPGVEASAEPERMPLAA